MFRDLLSKLTGSQVTAIVLALIFVPGAVGAAVTFQPVTIVDPVTGKQSSVDNLRRLQVFDPIAGYRNNPANLVEIYVSNDGSQCETSYQYAVPAGKALVLTAITGYAGGLTTYGFSGFHVYDGSGCGGVLLDTRLSSVSSGHQYEAVSVDYGAGIPVKAGRTVSVWSSNNFGYTLLHGYLVPAAAVPAVAPADAVNEPRPVTAAEVAAKMQKLPH